MNAAVQFEVPGSLTITDIDIDQPGPHEVLIRTVASGLCHSDLHFLEGIYPPTLPLVLGHEASGIVEAIGASVTGIANGDHVVTCLSTFCGTCEYCLTGRPVLCHKVGVERDDDQQPRLSYNGAKVNAFARLGAFAEQLLVHEHSVAVIRRDMPLELAALIGCSVTTGVGSVINSARIQAGCTVAVIGCGGVGLNVVQGSALAGARRIVAIDRVPMKLQLARKFGATDVVNGSQVDAVAAVRDLIPEGVDYAFEAIGRKQTAEQAFAMLAPSGTALIIGMIPPGETIDIPGSALMFGEKRLQGAFMGSNRFRVDIPRYIDLYMSGRLNLEDLVSKRIRLEEVNEGYEALKRGEVARSVIVFDS